MTFAIEHPAFFRFAFMLLYTVVAGYFGAWFEDSLLKALAVASFVFFSTFLTGAAINWYREFMYESILVVDGSVRFDLTKLNRMADAVGIARMSEEETEGDFFERILMGATTREPYE